MTKFKVKTLRLITTRSAFFPAEFSLAHRRIFSLLAYRSRLDLAISQREIAKESMTDPRTTKKVLAFLAERKLVEQQESKWTAFEPTGEIRRWFVENKNPKYDKHWSDQFSYSQFLIPKKSAKTTPGGSKRFTVNNSHVYSILSSLGKANREHAGIVNKIGVSRLSRVLNGLSKKTIRSSLNLLESIGLIVCYQEGAYQTIQVGEINNIHHHLFEQTKPKAKTPAVSKVEDPQEVSFRNEDAQAIYKDCRREGMSIQLAKDITVAATMAGIDRLSFDGYSEKAALEHAKNRLAGNVGVNHHGHLLRYKLEQVRQEQDRIEEKMLAPSGFTPVGTPDPLHKVTPNASPKTPLKNESRRSFLEQPSEDYLRQIGHELVTTKGWLRHKFGRTATASDITVATEDGRMADWCVQGRISPYFLAVSPEVAQVIKGKSLEECFGPRCAYEYRPSTIKAIQAKYDEEFGDLQTLESECISATNLNAEDEPVADENAEREFQEAILSL